MFATVAARNCAKTARLYALEAAQFGWSAPDARTIQLWAAEDGWQRQADAWWRETKGRTPYVLQIISAANTMQAQQALHDILTGMDQRPAEERAITLKAIEVAMKTRERVPDLARVEPPDADVDTEGKTREEREALAMQAVARGTRKGRSA